MIEIDGPEMPIMDGSAAQFVDAIDSVGVVAQSRRRRYHQGSEAGSASSRAAAHAELRPASRGFHLDVEIDFDVATIGRQRRAFDLEPETFRREISRARTFGFVADVKKLWQAGFALGSSLENSVALDGEAILNPRACATPTNSSATRRWMRSAISRLAGAPIIGAYIA